MHHSTRQLKKIQRFHEHRKPWKDLWNSFWNPPEIKCPKCGSDLTEYYDPFFFAPIRTLKGKRRIKCKSCRFIWRPSRTTKSIWDVFNPF
ncbi:MAG: hypothetical protein GX639_04350 [Fibrobacter sp.]|nr:hypothetical protein [Fibrobacter sp.]